VLHVLAFPETAALSPPAKALEQLLSAKHLDLLARFLLPPPLQHDAAVAATTSTTAAEAQRRLEAVVDQAARQVLAASPPPPGAAPLPRPRCFLRDPAAPSARAAAARAVRCALLSRLAAEEPPPPGGSPAFAALSALAQAVLLDDAPPGAAAAALAALTPALQLGCAGVSQRFAVAADALRCATAAGFSAKRHRCGGASGEEGVCAGLCRLALRAVVIAAATGCWDAASSLGGPEAAALLAAAEAAEAELLRSGSGGGDLERLLSLLRDSAPRSAAGAHVGGMVRASSGDCSDGDGEESSHSEEGGPQGALDLLVELARSGGPGPARLVYAAVPTLFAAAARCGGRGRWLAFFARLGPAGAAAAVALGDAAV
jgi:hypothetical protein